MNAQQRPAQVTSASGTRPPLLNVDRTALDRGLALWKLQVRAANPPAKPAAAFGAEVKNPSWVNRRVEQLEFLDIRAGRWRASIDFVVPDAAPKVLLGERDSWLVPLTTLPKRKLVAFDLRDEDAGAMCLPTSVETGGLFVPAIVWTARVLLNPQSSAAELAELPTGLAEDLAQIITAGPDEHKSEYAPFASAAASIDVMECQSELNEICESWRKRGKFRHIGEWCKARWKYYREWDRAQDALAKALENLRRARQILDSVSRCPDCPRNYPDDPRWAQGEWVDRGKCRRCAAYRLMRNTGFRAQLEELEQNFVMLAAVPCPPGTRLIVKWSSEVPISFWTHKRLWWRLGQSLGLLCWPVDVLIGGRGGSHHLEVAAPPGVDIVQIIAKPVGSSKQPPIRSRGLTPRVHIWVPATPPSRYSATIFVRTSRQGWLTASWLVAALIAVIMGLGRINLPVFFPGGAVSAEAGTAATLLLALVGVIATWLVRPGEHPLASRLLAAVRILILVDVAVVLAGTGDLVLHHATSHRTEDLWLALSLAAYVVAGFVTLARLFPVAPPKRWERTGWTGILPWRRGGAR